MTAEEPTPPSPERKSYRLLYIASALFSAGCLVLIILIWYRAYNSPYHPNESEHVMTSPQQANHFIDSLFTEPADSNIYIPTGLMVQSLQFTGPYTIQVAGYIWQRYSDSLPPLDRGVVFAEAASSYFNKLYETKQGNETLVGWNFVATIREQFDYRDYPLDHQLIWLRVWSVEFEKNVYLKPDWEGYSTLDATLLPGVDPEAILENWRLQRSYFSYRLQYYHANFGIRDYDPEIPQPELYFNIAIQRNILSPLISRGLTPVVILLQLFVIVMVIGSDSKRLEQFGVRPGAVIFTCAAFFFVILVAENALRADVQSLGMVYLEYLYVLSYFVILAVAINSVSLVAFPSSGLLRSDNMWVEVFYWPVIMLILLATTIIEFKEYLWG